MVGSLRIALVVALFAVGCFPELGECDPGSELGAVPGQAFEVVYLVDGVDGDGTPFYAGQALMQLHCSGNGTCHTADASERVGAPGGLDFDVDLACDTTTACNRIHTMSDAVLLRSHRKINEHDRNIWRTIQNGSMPPGNAGATARALFTFFRDYDPDTEVFSNELPSLDDAEGRRILQNWLSCGAPVVSQAREPDVMDRPGALCAGPPPELGECRIRASEIEPVEANWTAIYDRVIRPLCLGCHRDDGNDNWGPMKQELDLCLSTDPTTGPCDPAAVLASLINQPTTTCTTEGVLIVPNDADASIFLVKLGENVDACGSEGKPMPLGDDNGLNETAILAPIRDWIMTGAMATP